MVTQNRCGPISVKEFVAISEMISMDNSLYQALWRCSNFQWDTTIPTAAVGYDLISGQIGIFINPDFWDSLNKSGKRFVLFHEASHIFYDHLTYAGKSAKQRAKIDHKSANIAQDVAINHILEDYYIPDARANMPIELCFVDTVFSKSEVQQHKIVAHQRWTVYYDILMLRPKEEKSDLDSFDVHAGGSSLPGINGHPYGGFEDLPPELQQEVYERVNEEIVKSAGATDVEEAENAFNQAGCGSGGAFLNISRDANVVKNRKWEELVRNILASMIEKKQAEKSSWAMRSRNSFSLPADIILPGTVDLEVPEPKRRYKALFFLDSSGSCVSQASRFFNLVRTVPEDLFEVSLCSFDTRVYELELSATRVKGGGGTYFHILEDYIQQKCRNGEKYPDVVFVLSDGYGNRFNCQHPKRWVWLLTDNYTACIPAASKNILISKFL